MKAVKSRKMTCGFLWVFLLGLLVFGLPGLSAASEDNLLYDSHAKRDPFTPLAGPGASGSNLPVISLSNLKLEGIVVDPKQGSFVMLSGEIYEQGDRVGQYEVEKIEENRVILKYNGEQFELVLEEERI